MSKTYEVTFTETYTYTKNITIEDNEDINEVIHDPLEYPMVIHMTKEQYDNSNISVCNEYFTVCNGSNNQ